MDTVPQQVDRNQNPQPFVYLGPGLPTLFYPRGPKKITKFPGFIVHRNSLVPNGYLFPTASNVSSINPGETPVPVPSASDENAENNNYNNDFGLELILDIPDISVDPGQDENIVRSCLDLDVSDGENLSSDEGKVGSSLDIDVPDVLIVDDTSEEKVGSSLDIEGGDNVLQIPEWESLNTTVDYEMKLMPDLNLTPDETFQLNVNPGEADKRQDDSLSNKKK